MNESVLKKKNILKLQYFYNIILLLILSLGVSYALVNFIHNEEGVSGNIVSSLVKITVDEDISFSLDNTSPVSDEEGLQGYSKILTLTNTSTIDSLVTLSINPNASNSIPASNIKYGLYINEVLKKTGSLEDTTIYDGLMLQGEKIKIEVYLWVNSAYTETGNIFKGEFEAKSTEAVITMADYVTKLIDRDKGIYKIGNDYRYSGNDADNYIWFNCKDGTTGGSNNCELWRIVGSLETKSNQYANSYRRIKLVKVDNLDNRTFGSNNTFFGSTLDTYLNGEYYNSLTKQSKKMIISSEWNVGSSSLTNTPASSLTSEAKSKVYKNVGLLSASDIGYSTSTDNQTKALNNADLYANSWLKGSSYYTLTPVSGNTTSVIGNNATSITSLTSTTSNGVKPSVYLIPNVYIQGGNGTQDMPYEIALVDEVEHYSNAKVSGYITYNVNGQNVVAPGEQAILSDGSTIIKAELDNTEDFKFVGWATSANGEVVYRRGDVVSVTGDITLYAKWKTLHNYLVKNPTIGVFWPESIMVQKANITAVNFISMSQNEIDKRYDTALIKEDVTDITKGGSVFVWLETDATDITKYIMYVASDGITYFPSTIASMFDNFSNLKEVVFENVNTSSVVDMYSMFEGCSSLKSIDLSNWDLSNVQDIYGMFKGCSNLESIDFSSLNASKITQIHEMFYECSKLTSLDLSWIKTTDAINVHSMFYNCTSLTSVDLSNFQVSTTSNVNLFQMFYNCPKLMSIDIRKLDFVKVSGYYNMFKNVPNNSEIIVMNDTQKSWLTGKFSNLNNIQIPS